MIYIDISTFPAEGGSFVIQLTKDDNRPWQVNLPEAAWMRSVIGFTQSNRLYEISFDLTENEGSDRQVTFIAGSDLENESFTLTQLGIATSLAAEIVSQSPSGTMPASGGNFLVYVHSDGGTDNLTSASVTGTGVALVSTSHGQTVSGKICTLFVFSFAANGSTASRSATITFTVSDGINTATAVITKSQAGAAVSQGTLSIPSQTIGNAAGSLNLAISATDMRADTISVSSALGWLTSQQIQVSGNALVLTLVYPANSSSSARAQQITIQGTDTWGNTVTATATITQEGTTAPANRMTNLYWRNGSGDTAVVPYSGGGNRITAVFAGNWNGDAQIRVSPSVEGLSVRPVSSGTSSHFYWQVYFNGRDIERTQLVNFEIYREDADGVVVSASLKMLITAGAVAPIWKDTFAVIESDEDYEDYEITDSEGEILLTGRAFRYPDEDAIRVNVSRIIAPYLTEFYKDVAVYASDTLIGNFTLVRDYSYEDIDYRGMQNLNRLINGKVPPGVEISASKWAPYDDMQESLTVVSGSGAVIYDEELARGLNSGEWLTGSVGTTYTVQHSELKYVVVDACRAAFLKYLNAFGVYDYLLVEGVVKKKDSITRSSYEKDAAARTSQFETKDYQATMEAGWTGTTGWLTDEQSARMKHLVESVEVYMVDMQTGEEIPVVMKDNSLDYKTWFTNGRKMVNYTLTWNESQKKLRR